MTRTDSTLLAAHGFGERLKAARKKLDITQEELASRSGLSTITLSKLESGVNNPSFNVIVALSISLKVEPNYLFGWPIKIHDSVNSERRMKLQTLVLYAEQLDNTWLDELISLAKLASTPR
ncbi:helix-turn-helix transcriptional regulator [Brucella intermedia]|uniref:helix-turn-helix domain-containing protein n=1 Tax=Brucella intermedia TaxID=94625 RepID=UPI00124CFBDC|nr:helix-turn-helix transcriptional regulator [Brucella intermedia]